MLVLLDKDLGLVVQVRSTLLRHGCVLGRLHVIEIGLHVLVRAKLGEGWVASELLSCGEDFDVL